MQEFKENIFQYMILVTYNGKTFDVPFIESFFNIEDILNLEYLMITAYNKKIQSLPLELDDLEIPPKKDNPFEVDESIVNMYRPFSYF